MSKIAEHVRINESLLRPIEKPILQWLSAHMPSWVTPDRLTALGFMGSILIFTGYGLSNRDHAYLWLASFGFVVNWFGDSLDGTLARFRHIERPHYGFFIDHSIDAIETVLVFLGLGLSPYVDYNIASLGLVAYLLCSLLSNLLLNVYGEFRISFASFGPTEFRSIAILLNTIVFFVGNPLIRLPFGVFSLYNLLMIAITILLFSFYFIIMFRESRNLNRMDQK